MQGIYLISKLSDLKRHSDSGSKPGPTSGSTTGDVKAGAAAARGGPRPAPFRPAGGASQPPALAAALRPQGLEGHVISRYIDNPLVLLGGKKLDLRL
jgi:hypothetical protein